MAETPPEGRAPRTRQGGQTSKVHLVADRKWPVSLDANPYKERNTVERLINKLKAWRGIATLYGRTPDSYLAGLHLRAS